MRLMKKADYIQSRCIVKIDETFLTVLAAGDTFNSHIPDLDKLTTRITEVIDTLTLNLGLE